MAFADDLDMTPRYAPESTIVHRAGKFLSLPVQKYVVYPPGTHPAGCPLVKDITALELRTAAGSRWFGCASAHINSELRMVVVGTPARDEVRMKWPVCTIG